MLPKIIQNPGQTGNNSEQTQAPETDETDVGKSSEPRRFIKVPGVAVWVPKVGPTLVVRHLAGERMETAVHPFVHTNSPNELTLVHLPETDVPLKTGNILTDLQVVFNVPVPGAIGQPKFNVRSFAHQWPQPPSAQPAPAIALEAPPSNPSTNKPTKRERTSQRLIERLSDWGMDCTSEDLDFGPEEVFLFICGLDPTTKNYRFARHWISILPELNSDIDIEATDEFGRTALVLAIIATQKNTEMAKAAYARNFRLIKTLISKGVPLDKKDHKGKTALMYAVEFDLLDVATALCAAGADLHIDDLKRRNVWWYAAARSEDVKILDLLKRFSRTDALINVQDCEGKTPLMQAIQRLCDDSRPLWDLRYLVVKLLRYGANPALNDKNKDHAWIQAARSNRSWLVEILGHFDNTGITINAANLAGETAKSIVEARMIETTCARGSAMNTEDGDDADDADYAPDFLTALYRFGAAPNDGKLMRQYRKLRELEVRFADEFAAIKKRLLGAHAIELAKMKADCARLTYENSYLPYGGSTGNDYFSYFTVHIAEPVLAEFFKFAANSLSETDIEKKLFAPMLLQLLLDQAGQMRKHIHEVASVANPTVVNNFGERHFAGATVFDPVNAYPGWYKHVLREIQSLMLAAWDECAATEENVTLDKLLKRMDEHKDYSFYPGEEGKPHLIEKSDTTCFSILLPQELQKKRRLLRKDILKMKDIQIKCLHNSYPMDHPAGLVAAEALIAAISLPKGASLKRDLSKQLYTFMKHVYRSSYLERGTATFTEWVVAGICRRHGLSFAYPSWKTDGRRKNFALDHAFLSDFDGTFRQKFLDSVKFKPIAKT